MKQRVVIVFAAAGLIVACSRAPMAPTVTESASPSPSVPVGPAAAAGPQTASASPSGRETVRVNMLDACDPDTFNAAIGPGTCTRNGGMKFDRFTSLLQQLGFVGPWHFAPNNAHVATGQTFVAMNMGGETHTFTEVAAFGGGIVPILNRLGGFGAPAPECSALEPDDFVAPGGTYTETVDHAGPLKFQCCIHPWMRLEATSK